MNFYVFKRFKKVFNQNDGWVVKRLVNTGWKSWFVWLFQMLFPWSKLLQFWFIANWMAWALWKQRNHLKNIR